MNSRLIKCQQPKWGYTHGHEESLFEVRNAIKAHLCAHYVTNAHPENIEKLAETNPW